ncbi:uncharacterized protein TNCV_565871 [Trichonephila clavipes]|nr:uncharacterized protein TNCV_565871 [Trichonephila clavipes]
MASVLIARPSTALTTPQPVIIPEPPIPVKPELTTPQILLPDPPRPPVQIPVTPELTTSQILLPDPPPVQILNPPVQTPQPPVQILLPPVELWSRPLRTTLQWIKSWRPYLETTRNKGFPRPISKDPRCLTRYLHCLTTVMISSRSCIILKQGCDFWKRKKGSPAYKKWKILHVKECLKNHNGSAGMMETVGMVRIFQRSLSHRSVRYTSYIQDGDSKTFSYITASNTYGEDITVSKIECVGHVQKRMGTRLRKLKQMSFKLSDGKSIVGKGRLTDRMIDLITTYYGNAIRQNKTCLSDMRKAVWAVYFHIRSSDEEPLHSFCPVGPNSWCKYQNQVVEGSVETFRHSNKLPMAVMDAIKPVFNDLSQPKLLQKCLGGKTQNNNESINSLIWKLCPKTLGCGRKIVDISTNEVIVIFNDGNQGRLKIMQSLDLTVGQFAHKFVTLVDIKRIQTAEVHFNLRTKESFGLTWDKEVELRFFQVGRPPSHRVWEAHQPQTTDAYILDFTDCTRVADVYVKWLTWLDDWEMHRDDNVPWRMVGLQPWKRALEKHVQRSHEKALANRMPFDVTILEHI